MLFFLKFLFIFVDGFLYLFRVFYGLLLLINIKGQDIGVIYGVINMFKSLIKQYSLIYIGVVFDVKGKIFWDDIYLEYKVNCFFMFDELCL